MDRLERLKTRFFEAGRADDHHAKSVALKYVEA